jgi:hypothetical protein
MKKNYLLTFAFLGGMIFSANVSAQENPVKPEITINENLTPLRPSDGQPYVFATAEEMEEAKARKTQQLKETILANSDNPERVKKLRQELWRLENAVVAEKKK